MWSLLTSGLHSELVLNRDLTLQPRHEIFFHVICEQQRRISAIASVQSDLRRYFTMSLSAVKDAEIMEAFNSTSRYLDGVLNIDNTYFSNLPIRTSIK